MHEFRLILKLVYNNIILYIVGLLTLNIVYAILKLTVKSIILFLIKELNMRVSKQLIKIKIKWHL